MDTSSTPSTARVDDLYVRAGARNRGVGRHLLASLAEHASPEQVLIRWEMRADNDVAQLFYRRLGATLRTKVTAAWRPHDYANNPAHWDGTRSAR